MRSRLFPTMGIGLVLAAAVLIGAAPASALPGPSSLSTGLVQDTLIGAYAPGPVPAAWFTRMQQLDSSWVRITAIWSEIAPSNRPPAFDATDPSDRSYNWSYLDAAVRSAFAAHQRILLTLASPPVWALGRNPPRGIRPLTWLPSAVDYGAFARAAAKRYSGRFHDPVDPARYLPRVADFQAWNEPNLGSFLAPQWVRTARGYRLASPAVYRTLLNAMYANVKAVQPGAYVLLAGLAPYGDPAGGGRIRPVQFLRALLCLSGPHLRPQPCRDPAHFDAIDIHPYAVTPTHHAYNADDVSIADVAKLSRALRAAESTHRVLPRGPKPIWATELDWDSSPPDPAGVSLGRQAQYISRGLYELWRQGVSHVFWFEVRDPGTPGTRLSGGGLYFSNGRPKPATEAFRFPFVAIWSSHGVLTIWGRAPNAGPVTIAVARGRGWRVLVRVATSRGGVFYIRRHLGGRLTLRARAGTSVSYTTSTS